MKHRRGKCTHIELLQSPALHVLYSLVHLFKKNQITILNREGSKKAFSNTLVMNITLTLKSAS